VAGPLAALDAMTGISGSQIAGNFKFYRTAKTGTRVHNFNL
jgi:hypothetical protein